jgi:hypothetical protein
MPARLEELLDEFKAEMLAKFRLREERQRARGAKSVTDLDFDWKRGLDPNLVESHLREEWDEWIKASNEEERIKEDIDVANTCTSCTGRSTARTACGSWKDP